ncbi:MAG: hypothetical protein NTV52_27880, partial [Acidobacteria bacterium]|nr:hypothetical protein [Acidobacteriota bacterium]
MREGESIGAGGRLTFGGGGGRFGCGWPGRVPGARAVVGWGWAGCGVLVGLGVVGGWCDARVAGWLGARSGGSGGRGVLVVRGGG